jgi:hypothetical protein
VKTTAINVPDDESVTSNKFGSQRVTSEDTSDIYINPGKRQRGVEELDDVSSKRTVSGSIFMPEMGRPPPQRMNTANEHALNEDSLTTNKDYNNEDGGRRTSDYRFGPSC